MRNRFVALLGVVGLAAVCSPGQARAESTCPNVFDVCVDFTLAQSGGTWYLTTSYSSSPSGMLTSTGIYYNAGSTVPDFGIGDVAIDPAKTGWATGCTDLNMNSGSTSLLGACGSTTNGINNALAPGGFVQISFTANSAFETALNGGELDYRAHIQGYGATSCSIKLDTGVQGDVGSSGSDCTPTSSVPEPATFLLLGTGLLALGGVRRIRRRHVVTA